MISSIYGNGLAHSGGDVGVIRFRFGPEIAEAASQVLGTLGEKRKVRGNPTIQSEIVDQIGGGTILARTNATVMVEVLAALAADQRPHVIGDVGDLKRLVGDAFELKEGRPGICPEFFGFTRWQEVVEFAGTEEGEDLKTFVQLVEQHGERKLYAALKNVHSDEDTADVVISTGHKAKGREWDRVQLAPDFLSSRLANGLRLRNRKSDYSTSQ